MHELSIITALLDVVTREGAQRGVQRITRLNCRVGCLRQADPSMMQDAFAAARVGTLAETATLVVAIDGMILDCRNCGVRSQLGGWQFDCPICGSTEVGLTGGDELELTSMEGEVGDDDRSA